MSVTNRLHSWFTAATLSALLAACGGGGGSDDAAAAGPVLQAPPATAGALTQSGTEAMAAVQAAHSNAALMVKKSSALEGGSLFAPLGASGSPLNLRNVVAGAAREQALARETANCADLGLVNCSGSVTFDSNFDDNANTLPAGTYVAMQFNSLSFSEGGVATSMNGGFRMDFLTAIDLQTSSFANARMQVTLNNLGGTVNGISFGPDTALALYEFDANGAPAVTIDGLRITGLGNLNVTDASNYSAYGTSLRAAHWSNSGAYVDVNYSSWLVIAGRPVFASAATISAGPNGSNGSAAIVVDSSTASQVVYRVRLTTGGTSTDYVVTANLGTSPPSYTVSGG
jgi:hypothetical protein